MAIDYYLVPDGVLIEEFVRHRDYSARGLCGALWTVGEPRWRAVSSFSRAVRTDPDLRKQVTVLLATGDDSAVGPIIDELTAVLRQRGLIPVTTERFD